MNIPSNLNVLVVDDHMMVRTLVEQGLKALGGCKIVHAIDGVDALEKINKAHDVGIDFHIVFLDWHMPNVSGLEVLEKCRSDGKFSKTAFVMLTAEREEVKVLEALQKGATSYIVKPFSTEVLNKNMQKILEWLNSQGVALSYPDGGQKKSDVSSKEKSKAAPASAQAPSVEEKSKTVSNRLPEEITKELEPIISKGMEDIFSVLFQVDVVPEDHPGLKEGSNLICLGRIFQDDIEICLRFFFSYDLLQPLLSNLYSPTYLDRDSVYEDAACEIVNILSAQVKAFLNQKGYDFDFSLPTLAKKADLSQEEPLMNVYFSLNASESFLVDLRQTVGHA